jgi:hypothetical protein
MIHQEGQFKQSRPQFEQSTHYFPPMRSQPDQRRSPRQSVDRPARIVLPGGKLPCRISDVSEGGARLETTSSTWLPNVFGLEDVFKGVSRVVAKVWSESRSVGVRFLNKR